MKRRPTYWVGPAPAGVKRWAYTTSGAVIDDPEQREAIFRMHRRYVKQWNDIELDHSRSLSEHTHEVLGAQVVNGGRRFILHGYQEPSHWILEILYARGFSEFHPDWSCGKNPFRTTEDMRHTVLHWSDDGRTTFEQWMEAEKLANHAKGEASEYVTRRPGRRP